MFKQKLNENLNTDWEMKRQIEQVVRERLDELFKKKTKEMTEKIQDMVLTEMLKETK